MDSSMISAASDLRDLLAAQDMANRQLSALDSHINELGQRCFAAELEGNSLHSLRLMLRVSVSEGVRQVYEQYQQQKQVQVQDIATTVIRTLDSDSTSSPDLLLHTPGSVRSPEGHQTSTGRQPQTDKAAGRWSGFESSFYRGS